MKAIFFNKTKPKEGFTLLVSKDNSYLNDLEVGRLRLGNTEDVSNAVEFLMSEKSSFITGQNIIVDGGWLSSAWFGKYKSRK